MKVIAVVGPSESGKTRLIVRLIGELKGRGLRISAIKRCGHGFSLDTEGKDTADFTRAGAGGVAMVSPDGWAAIGQEPVPDEGARLAARLFPDADIVLIEGGKRVRGIRKIEVLSAGVSAAPASPPEDLVAVVLEGPAPGAFPVPAFGPGDVAALADRILSLEEDEVADITLVVDGNEVNLNAFVQSFIERTVVGMVTSLSGVDPDPRAISLVIRRAAEPVTGERKP
jgi:molybdopterin-guanine dinucleotide biosynthesis protein MobB